MNFEDWKKEYGLVYEPNYSLHTEMDCLAAFKAGQQSKQQKIDELIKSIDWHIEDCEIRLLMNKNNYYKTDLKQHYSQLRNIWNNLQRELAEMLTLFFVSCILGSSTKGDLKCG